MSGTAEWGPLERFLATEVYALEQLKDRNAVAGSEVATFLACGKFLIFDEVVRQREEQDKNP